MVIAAAVLALPAAPTLDAAENLALPVKLVRSCNELVPFQNRLTMNSDKPSKATFGSNADVKALKSIAAVFASSAARSYGAALKEAAVGKERRMAVQNAYGWCDSEGAFEATTVKVASRFQSVNSDDVVVTGSANPGARVTVSVPANAPAFVSARSATGTADATGAFSLSISGLPLEVDVNATVLATAPERAQTKVPVTLRRTLSEPAKLFLAGEAEAEFKASAQTPPYNELLQYAPAILGQRVVYRVKVIQPDFNSGSDAFLGYVTPGNVASSDLMYFKLPNAISSGISKDGIVTVWGTVAMPYTYTTPAGSYPVPSVDVNYIG